MPSKKSHKENKEVKGKDWKGFINVSFDSEEKKTISEWIEKRTVTFEDAVIEVVEQGYRVTINYDGYHDCYSCSLTGRTSGTKYDGYTMTFLHSDLVKLMGVACYVVAEILMHGGIETPEDKPITDW